MMILDDVRPFPLGEEQESKLFSLLPLKKFECSKLSLEREGSVEIKKTPLLKEPTLMT